jgi:hypothetical protein
MEAGVCTALLVKPELDEMGGMLYIAIPAFAGLVVVGGYLSGALKRLFGWRERRARRRERLGLCVKCGYDLRASKNRCPECGTPFVRTAKELPITEGAASPADRTASEP